MVLLRRSIILSVDFNDEKKVIMLIGLPLTGKTYFSEYLQNNFTKKTQKYIVISSDDIVKLFSKVLFIPHNTVYNLIKNYLDYALEVHTTDFFEKHSSSSNPIINNVIWDDVHATKKERIEKLKMIPESWKKIAIFFPEASDEEFKQRKKISEQEYRYISDKNYSKLKRKMEYPDLEEGFDVVHRVTDFNF